jgi:hypothetical protein
MTNLRRQQLEIIKSQADYTQEDAERDYAAGNTQALVGAAYRIADGTAAQYAKLAGFNPPPDWFALARELAAEKATGWRPETKYRGLPITFPKFIMRAVKQWADRVRGQYNKEKGEIERYGGGAEAASGDDYVLAPTTGTDAMALHHVDGTTDPRAAADNADAERLNPKDDGQGGTRQERITSPLAKLFMSRKYDATDEPGMLEDYLATISAPVDRKVFGGWLRNSRPGTQRSVRKYARGARRKVDGHTEAQVLEFAVQVWKQWEAFRDFAAGHQVAMPVWDIRVDANGAKTVFLPPSMTPASLGERPSLLLSLAAALDLGALTEKYWLEAHPGKLPKHFKNEWGQMLYNVKKLEPADRQGFEAWLRTALGGKSRN